MSEEELQKEVDEMRQMLEDLEVALTVASEHGDIIEQQLIQANDQLLAEISQREAAQRRLQALVDAISQQKSDLEIIINTLIEHGDSTDQQMWAELLQAEKRSATDSLTGLANRRAFDEHLNEHYRAAIREKRPVSLLLGDVDFFKAFNDTYGHAEGDTCLQRVGQVFQDLAKRPQDLAVRYGGEEFALILPETDEAGATLIAQKIVQDIEALAVPHTMSKVSSVVTISIGCISTVPSQDLEQAALVAQADHLLYRAKQLGRNRYCASDTLCDLGD